MIKVKVIKDFTLEEFGKIQNLVRANTANRQDGHLYKNDEFECDQNMCDYLMGKNDKGVTVVEILEIIPEIKKKLVKSFEEAPKEDELTKKQVKHYTTKKKKTSKK